jgi:hypothetical protein
MQKSASNLIQVRRFVLVNPDVPNVDLCGSMEHQSLLRAKAQTKTCHLMVPQRENRESARLRTVFMNILRFVENDVDHGGRPERPEAEEKNGQLDRRRSE